MIYKIKLGKIFHVFEFNVLKIQVSLFLLADRAL